VHLQPVFHPHPAQLLPCRPLASIHARPPAPSLPLLQLLLLLNPGDVYSAYNKPVAVIDWLAKTQVEEDYVLVLDADMIMREPFLPEVMLRSPLCCNETRQPPCSGLVYKVCTALLNNFSCRTLSFLAVELQIVLQCRPGATGECWVWVAAEIYATIR
jgi:hypothetical protein